MGTIGLSFGSATSGAGFDVASTVTSILGIQQATEAPLKAQLTALQAQDTVFTSLGTDLSTLTTSLQSLTDATGVLAEKQGSSSDTNILALTSADTTAVAGSHTVVVSSLASTASAYSNSIPSADTISGSITINGTPVAVGSGSTASTLAGLAAAINLASVGATASVITDANGSRLSLVSTTSGSAGAVTVSSTVQDGSTALSFTTTGGANAALTVDGLPISSASNTVTGAIPGVTFQLLSQSPGTSVQIQVTNDNTAIEAAVSSLVTAYNSVISVINGQEKTDTSGNAEPLFGSATLSLIQTQLQGALFGGAASGSISNIAQLGISVGDDGTLTLDTSALDNSLNAHFADITGFLQNSGSFGQNFTKVLNSLGTQQPNGSVYLAQQQNTAQEAALNATIATKDAAIAAEKITLTAQLTTANQELQAIPEQLNEINEIYSAISGFNQNSSS